MPARVRAATYSSSRAAAVTAASWKTTLKLSPTRSSLRWIVYRKMLPRHKKTPPYLCFREASTRGRAAPRNATCPRLLTKRQKHNTATPTGIHMPPLCLSSLDLNSFPPLPPVKIATGVGAALSYLISLSHSTASLCGVFYLEPMMDRKTL